MLSAVTGGEEGDGEEDEHIEVVAHNSWKMLQKSHAEALKVFQKAAIARKAKPTSSEL